MLMGEPPPLAQVVSPLSDTVAQLHCTALHCYNAVSVNKPCVTGQCCARHCTHTHNKSLPQRVHFSKGKVSGPGVLIGAGCIIQRDYATCITGSTQRECTSWTIILPQTSLELKLGCTALQSGLCQIVTVQPRTCQCLFSVGQKDHYEEIQGTYFPQKLRALTVSNYDLSTSFCLFLSYFWKHMSHLFTVLRKYL